MARDLPNTHQVFEELLTRMISPDMRLAYHQIILAHDYNAIANGAAGDRVTDEGLRRAQVQRDMALFEANQILDRLQSLKAV